MANLNLNREPRPPAPGWETPRRSLFRPLLYGSLIPLACISGAIIALGDTSAGSLFAILSGIAWAIVWFCAGINWMMPSYAQLPRPPIRLPREDE